MKEKGMIRLLLEMLKNSRRSDRDLAKVLGVSQPTVTRTRQRLEKDYIRTYTLVPELDKIGYEIIAFTFFKSKTYEKGETEKMMQSAREWCDKHANVIFAAEGEGLGKDAVIVSLHRGYSSYADFMREFTVDWASYAMDLQSFLVSIKNGVEMKPFDLKYLSEDKSILEQL
jgi:DNA-binding Lrp family transcriptional regulator